MPLAAAGVSCHAVWMGWLDIARQRWVTRLSIGIVLGCGVVAAHGCGEPESRAVVPLDPAGSGSASSGSVVDCSKPPTAPIDDATRAAAPGLLRGRIERATAAPVTLYWTYMREAGTPPYAAPDRSRRGVETRIAIELTSLGPGPAQVIDTCQTFSFSVPAALRVSTADGKLDATFTGTVRAPVDGAGAITFEPASDKIPAGAFETTLRSIGVEPAQSIQSLTVVFLEAGFSGELRVYPEAGFETPFEVHDFARFSSELPTATEWREIEPPAALVDACSAALAKSNPTPLDNEPNYDMTQWPTVLQSWLDRLSGRWALCDGAATRTPDHAGIELSSDGSWHHFVARDATSLVEARGIDHEGFASPGITVPMVPGQVPLQLIGMAAPFAEHSFLATLSRDLSVLRLTGASEDSDAPVEAIDYVYVAIPDLRISETQLVHARGERAGSAGCTDPTAYLQPRATAVEPLEAQLAGTWSLCGTRLDDRGVSIRFDGAGRYQLRAADGSEVRSGSYAVNPGLNVELARDGSPNASYSHWLESVMMFDAPRVMQFWLYEPDFGTRTRVVWSAMP
jgi:hypothetical protein